ncbi:MAG: hypothetical protein WAX69_05375, partial [Victivallales bacterium]
LSLCIAMFASGCAAGNGSNPDEGLCVRYTLERPAFVTVVIDDREGRRVRNLVSCVWRESGIQREPWDGLDDLGKPAPAGEYRWHGILHDPVTAHFQGTFDSPGDPPWLTSPRQAINQVYSSGVAGGWLADHTPPKCVCAGDGRIFIGAPMAEAGHSLIEVTPEGRKVWGSLWLALAGSDALAYDDGILYVAAEKGWMNDKLAVNRITAKDHRYVPNSKEVMDRHKDNAAAFIKVASSDFSGIRGIAVTPSWIVLSLSDRNRLALFDRQTADFVRDLPLPEAGGLARGPQGDLYAVSGRQVLRLDLEKGAHQPVVSSSLEQPCGLTVDGNGDFYVTDQAPGEQCVKVFDSSGKFLRRIGKQGGRKEGTFDPLAISHPGGVAIDARGQVWITENDFLPKRVSVWSRDGNLILDLVGPPHYGGGGSLDPKRKESAFYRGMAFEWENWPERSRLKAVLFRPEEHADLPLPLDASHELNQLNRAASRQGKLYLISDFSWALPGAFIGEVKDDRLVPRAILGSLPALRKAWKTSHAAFLEKLGEPTKAKPNTGVFLWSDRNGDGKAQEEEVSIQKDWSFGSQWSYRMGQDLEFHACTADGLVRIPPRGDASLSYDLADAKITPLPPGYGPGNIIALSSDSSGNYILNLFHRDGDPRNVLMGLAPDGKVRWTYPNPYPTNTHSSPLPKVGELRHTLNVEGFAKLDGGMGEIFQLNGNKGIRYLITTDGLFVAQLQADARIAPLTRDLPLKEDAAQRAASNPKTSDSAAPMAWYDMRLDQVSLEDECFYGWLGRIGNGPIFQIVGKDSCNVTEVRGLSTLKRMDGGAISITQEAQEKAVRKAARPQRIRLVQAGPFASGANTEMLNFPQENPVAAFRVTYDNHGLNLIIDVKDETPFVNRGQDWKTLFKTGDAVDLRFAANADLPPGRTAAGTGDIRLLLSMFEDKPVAVRYRFVVPNTAEPEKFASPTGVATVDRVSRMPEVEIKVDRKDKGYRLEARIPWIVLRQNGAPKGVRMFDIGVLMSDTGGDRCVARYYYFDQESQVVADLPSETRVNPSHWGEIEF